MRLEIKLLSHYAQTVEEYLLVFWKQQQNTIVRNTPFASPHFSFMLDVVYNGFFSIGSHSLVTRTVLVGLFANDLDTIRLIKKERRLKMTTTVTSVDMNKEMPIVFNSYCVNFISHAGLIRNADL